MGLSLLGVRAYDTSQQTQKIITYSENTIHSQIFSREYEPGTGDPPVTQGDKAHVLGELSRTKTGTQAPPASPEHASFNHIPSADSGAGREITGNLRGSSLPPSIFSGVLVSVLPKRVAKCKRCSRETAVRGSGEGAG